ncbi:MAG TPA: DinB family protein [Gemmatimonadaceae bacterium]|nr:DinB family protein [Gemmatimonadaceae bacterium]
MSFAKDLASLFARDLSRLAEQLRAFSTDDAFWETPPGITNSAGTLSLHLDGNLREYIGRQLGGVSYTRDRPSEFSARGVSRDVLIARISELCELIPSIVASLSETQIEAIYPEQLFDAPMTTGEFLLHLYGHLNWHRGQLDYVRRIVARR